MSLAVRSGRRFSREGLVERPRLVAKLTSGRHMPLVSIVAPAGYGKTSLLADWTDRDERPSAWLELERGWHNEPVCLVREILAALDELLRAGAVLDGSDRGPAVELALERLSSLAAVLEEAEPDAHVTVEVLPALATTLEAWPHPIALVLDDAHSLTSTTALHAIATVAEHLPFGSQLVLASRTRLDLPLGRLRAHRALLELGVADMAMEPA
ncbi:MAG: AAA family ATPase, partial [Solirubrobacteraceae bacterium]